MEFRTLQNMASRDAIFLHADVRELFQNKVIVVLGDSIQRSVYKDLVCLWSDPESRYVEDSELREKGEASFRQDKLLFGGKLAKRTNGTDYREEREYRDGNTVFRYYFITRCWNEYVQSVLQNQLAQARPHVIIMNSCCWDIHRYGEEGKKFYGPNLDELFLAISRLPSQPLLVWNSALPLAKFCKGGFLRKGFDTISPHEIEEANAIAFSLTEKYGFLYLDLYESISQHHIFTQAGDGIHWGNRAHRNMSNSILSAISDCWGYNVVEKVPTALIPTSLGTPLRFDEYDMCDRYGGNILLREPGSGRYDYDYTEGHTMPLFPTIDQPLFLTPPAVQEPHLRYHPYYDPNGDHYKYHNPAFATNRIGQYRQSQTDPFPLSQQPSRQQLNYQSRFKTVKKKLNNSTPVNNAANTRNPLQEVNTPLTPDTGPIQLAAKQASSAMLADGQNKKEPECSTYQSAVAGTSTDTNTDHSNASTVSEALNMTSGAADQSGEIQAIIGIPDAKEENATNSIDKAETGKDNIVCHTNQESILHSANNLDKVEVIDIPYHESVVNPMDNSVAEESDVNSNENVDNNRKRKREKETSETEEDQTKKQMKIY